MAGSAATASPAPRGFFEQLGFRPGKLFAGAAAGTEIVAGLLVAFGLLGPLGPALIVSVMIVAAATVHWQHGLFASNNGIEVPLLYGVAALTLALTGYGAFSLDAALALTWSEPVIWAVLAARRDRRIRESRDPQDRAGPRARLKAATKDTKLSHEGHEATNDFVIASCLRGLTLIMSRVLS